MKITSLFDVSDRPYERFSSARRYIRYEIFDSDRWIATESYWNICCLSKDLAV